MNLCKRGEYAMRLLVRLAIAQRAGRPLVTTSELAMAERLPPGYVEKLIPPLCQAGWIARHGANCRLVVDPRSLHLGTIVRHAAAQPGPGEACYPPCPCPSDGPHPGLHRVMAEIHDAIASILDRYTLAHVASLGQNPTRFRRRLPIPVPKPILRMHRRQPAQLH